jgi:hypothetical protein
MFYCLKEQNRYDEVIPFGEGLKIERQCTQLIL